MRTKQGGFTLLELVITLIILAIMLTMGLPAMSKMIQSTNVRQAANTLVRDFNIARSHASDLNQNVTLCRRKSTTSTDCRGAGTGLGWNTVGWVIFVDDNQDAVPDTAGQFLKITDSISKIAVDHNGVSGNQFDGSVRFFADGTVRDALGRLATVDFDVCSSNSSVTGRVVDMNSRGNIRTSIDDGTGCP